MVNKKSNIVRSFAVEYLTFITATEDIEKNSVIRKFRITAADGKNYNTKVQNFSEGFPLPLNNLIYTKSTNPPLNLASFTFFFSHHIINQSPLEVCT